MSGKHAAGRPGYQGRAVALAISEDARLYARHRRRSIAARLWRRTAVLGGVGAATVAATLGGLHEPGLIGGARVVPPPTVVDSVDPAPAGPARGSELVYGAVDGAAGLGFVDVAASSVSPTPPPPPVTTTPAARHIGDAEPSTASVAAEETGHRQLPSVSTPTRTSADAHDAADGGDRPSHSHRHRGDRDRPEPSDGSDTSTSAPDPDPDDSGPDDSDSGGSESTESADSPAPIVDTGLEAVLGGES